MGISIKQVFDKDLIRSVMLTPEIQEKASSHYVDGFNPLIDDKNGWFLFTLEDSLVGIINAHHVNSTTLQIHPYILKEHAKESRNALKAFYEWVLPNESINKLICMIPDCFKCTINFAHKVGFIDEGYLKDSYNRDNQLYGVAVLGITRPEIEEYINE
jgi:RimJ/RimL family protein N-acetyltransferase